VYSDLTMMLSWLCANSTRLCLRPAAVVQHVVKYAICHLHAVANCWRLHSWHHKWLFINVDWLWLWPQSQIISNWMLFINIAQLVFTTMYLNTSMMNC